MAKQKVFSAEGNVSGYELLFRGDEEGFGGDAPVNIKATSRIIMNTLTNVNTDELLGKKGVAFVTIDEQTLVSGVVDVLDKKRFVLTFSASVQLSDKVIDKVKLYQKRGFSIAVEGFDCSAETIKKFAPVLKHLHFLKIDLSNAETDNLDAVMKKLKNIGIRFIAQNIETKEEGERAKTLGFDFLQGHYLHVPESVEIEGYKEVTHLIILQLIRLIKNDAETMEIETFIKQRADLSFKLIKFLNNQESFDKPVESITQVITLLGRDKLLRWLLVYLYSEISTNPASKTILNFAIRRAEIMEEDALYRDKEKAYLAGMFSLLGAVFDTNIKELMMHVNMDRDITNLVVDKKGKFAQILLKIEKAEKEYLKKAVLENFDKFNTVDIIYLLEKAGIETDLK